MGTAEIIGEAAKEIIKPAYEDLAQPAAQASGKALGTLMNAFNLLLAPLERANLRSEAKTERLRQELAKGFEEIPPERRVEPPLEVVGPALESLKWVEDETLQDMFVKLLTSAMDSKKQSKTHRAFVKVIDRMSSFDAKILEMISNGDILFARVNKDETTPELRNFIPFAFFQNGMRSNHLVERSLENLLGLKLISVNELNQRGTQQIILDCINAYMEPEYLETCPKDYANILSFVKEEYSSTFPFDFRSIAYILNREIETDLPIAEISFTRFGSDFCSTCIK